MVQKALRHIAAIGILLGAPAILGAGANTWTGSSPVAVPEGSTSLVSADPNDPDVVYAAFATELYRSGNGGRTWRHLRSFGDISALLVHPASASTIYVGIGGWSAEVYRSSDAGETWSLVLQALLVESLAGSPTDPNVVFVGADYVIHKSSDAGRTWTTAPFGGVVASLVIDPRDPATMYAGAEGLATNFVDYPGSFGKTEDSGSTWTRLGEEPPFDSVLAVEIDPATSQTLYVATGPYRDSDYDTKSEVFRSEDGGISWKSANEGLPDSSVRSLKADPHVSGTLYAGTESGVYRTLDGGRSWASFGRQLSGLATTSLAIGVGGRLLAGTSRGLYDLQAAHGPMDVASTAGGSRVLVWDGDHSSVGTLGASGGWTSGLPGGSSTTWTAVALAESGGGRSHVLWQNGDGRSSLEILSSSGRQSAIVFSKRSGWIASDLSVRTDGQTNVLWTGPEGSMSIARVSASGAVSEGLVYGPAPGWSAVAIADAAGNDTWILWRATNGRLALSVHRDGEMVWSYKYAADADWSAEDLTVGEDGRPRLLRTGPDGLASAATIDAGGRLTASQSYGLPGFTPRRIAAGADGLTRVLFGGDDGHGELLLLNPDNTLRSQQPLE